MLLTELAALVIELSCRFEANLLKLVFLGLTSLHTHLKNLAHVLVQWLVCHRTNISVKKRDVRDIVQLTKTVMLDE